MTIYMIAHGRGPVMGEPQIAQQQIEVMARRTIEEILTSLIMFFSQMMGAEVALGETIQDHQNKKNVADGTPKRDLSGQFPECTEMTV
jgi:hypothetical protein